MCHMHANRSTSDLLPFIELKYMKTPSYKVLKASNKSALLFQDLFSYGADKSTQHDKC